VRAVSIEVVEATEVTPELREAMDRLVPQLSKSNPPPSDEQLAAILTSRATTMFVAVDTASGEGPDGRIVGSLTLALFRIPTGLRAWIEDVMVDEVARRRGVGEALNLAAIDRARTAGATTVDLTSRPSREAANQLYLKLGFQPRETNVYRFDL
jgi:ribosomal protein S18 acetylase RimI-like enzyme